MGIELVYLPPYSPDLMPVERLWQWLRQHLTALHCHREEDELSDRIATFKAQLNDAPTAVHTRLRPRHTWTQPKKNFGFEAGSGLDALSTMAPKLVRVLFLL